MTRGPRRVPTHVTTAAVAAAASSKSVSSLMNLSLTGS